MNLTYRKHLCQLKLTKIYWYVLHGNIFLSIYICVIFQIMRI